MLPSVAAATIDPALVKAAKALLVTGWYDADQLPARSGVYEVESAPDKGESADFRYFDGARWYYGASTPHRAFYWFQSTGLPVSPGDGKPWRGLMEKAT